MKFILRVKSSDSREISSLTRETVRSGQNPCESHGESVRVGRSAPVNILEDKIIIIT